MKVLKFGSASIATANRLKGIADIVVKEQGSIIVLSSMKGTAESLTEISEYLHQKNQDGACEIITRLEIDYLALTSNIFDVEEYRIKAAKLVSSIF